MITINSDDVVQVSFDNKTYSLSDPTSYTDFLIAITNPNPGVVLSKESFIVDPGLSSDSDKAATASRYSQFLQSFIDRRTARLEECASAIEKGETSLSEADKLLVEQPVISQQDIVEPTGWDELLGSGEN